MTGADAGAPTPSAQVLFASLEGGAVLAVVAGAGGNKVVVLPPCDTTQTQCTTPQPAGTLSAQLGMNAALFSAAHSAPVLWTGTAWLRWDPWAAHFVALSQADAGTSASGPAGYANLAADPGLALWVSARGTFNGYRYDTRGPFVNDIPIGPSSTAPDRINVAGQGPTVGWGAMGLTIGGGAKVFVTDATFDDVTVKVTMANALADVVFRDDRGCEYEIGGAVPTSVPPCTVSDLSPCDFASLGDGEQEVLEVARRGGNITVTTSGKQAPTCAPHFPQGARLSVGFHGGSSASLLSDLSVSRGP
jgi:hypothetical protein